MNEVFCSMLGSMFNERHGENGAVPEKSDKGDEGDLKSCHTEENWKKWDFFTQRRDGNGES